MARLNCRGDVVIVTCPQPCPETQTITIQSNNLTGISVLDSWDGTTGNFRGVVAGNSMVTVTLDNVNHTIVITPQAAAIAAALPSATTTQVGVLETATDAEALAKSATDKIVTPSNFAAMGATTSFAGLIEIATLAEVQAGTATNLAVVPDTLGDMNFLSLANAAANVSGGPVTVNLTAGYLTLQSPGGFTGLMLDNAALDFSNGAPVTYGTVPANDSIMATDSGAVAYPLPIPSVLTDLNTTVWGAPTGIMSQTTFAGIAPITFSNPPTQAECNAAGIQISILSQRLAALVTNLMATQKPHAT